MTKQEIRDKIETLVKEIDAELTPGSSDKMENCAIAVVLQALLTAIDIDDMAMLANLNAAYLKLRAKIAHIGMN